MVATQNVQDLLRSDEGTVVASNCALILCGGHRAVEVASMERAFGLTEEQRRRSSGLRGASSCSWRGGAGA